MEPIPPMATNSNSVSIVVSGGDARDFVASLLADVNNGSVAGGALNGAGVQLQEDDEVAWLNRRIVFFVLLTVYLLVIVGGVLGNGSILMTLVTSGRVPRNPLLVVLCLSDFFVSGLSAPITVITSPFVQNSWAAGPRACMAMYFLQYYPVASSTICHLLLSVDRYDTVKRPRVLHLRKKLIPILVALFALALAALASMPFLFVHPTTSPTNSTTTTTITTTTATTVTASAVSPFPEHPSTENTTTASTKPPSPPPVTNPTTDHHIPTPAVVSSHSVAVSETSDVQKRLRKSTAQANSNTTNCMCTSPENELVSGWYTSFILLHTLCVFVLPGLGILLNHVRVRKKLCALSLCARAAHGELPLPMPLLRRPTHVIIVTGMANSNLTTAPGTSRSGSRMIRTKAGSSASQRAATAGRGGVSQPVEQKPQREVKRKPQSKRLGPHDKRRRGQPRNNDEGGGDLNDTPLDERPMIVSSREHNRNLRATPSNASTNQQNPEFPLPQTSTLIYRRRLANILMTSAFLFLVCWLPYTVAVVYYELRGRRARMVTDLGLLIGYIYSALNPIIYFTLNHNSLRQSISCSLCSRLVSMRRFLRVSLGIHNSGMAAAAPSSTNEAALGPFNPRYIKPRQFCKDKESSHFVY